MSFKLWRLYLTHDVMDGLLEAACGRILSDDFHSPTFTASMCPHSVGLRGSVNREETVRASDSYIS